MNKNERCIVAVEGFDGAGKSTLTRALRAHYAAIGIGAEIIGRGDEAGEFVADLTALIKRSDGVVDGLTPLGDAYVRLARTYERIDRAHASPATLVLFDRFSHYDLSRLDAPAHCGVESLFVEATRESDVAGVLLLEAPFDVLWQRILERGEESMSLKERLGPEHNRHGYERLARSMDDAQLGVPVVRIDATLPIAEVIARAVAAVDGWMQGNPELRACG